MCEDEVELMLSPALTSPIDQPAPLTPVVSADDGVDDSAGNGGIVTFDGAPHVAPLPDGAIPRHTGGMSGESRRWTLRDAAPGEFRATFPELQVNVVITDGCGCQ
jgi:hypothetical protein